MFDGRLQIILWEQKKQRESHMQPAQAQPAQEKSKRGRPKLNASGSKKESQVQAEILQWLLTEPIKQVCFVFRQQSVGVFDPIVSKYRFNHGPGRIKGVSDILGVVGRVGIEQGLLTGLGRFLAIEVKGTTGRLTPEQAEFLIQVNNRGGLGFVARSVEDVQEAFKREGIWQGAHV
jgi:hypothetical protein